MALSLETSRAAAPIDWACNDASEMRGVFELQAMLLSDLARRENEMKGFSKTQHPLDGQNQKIPERYRGSTCENMEDTVRLDPSLV
jgi:hypothetical protein